jgi:hypothetical protein
VALITEVAAINSGFRATQVSRIANFISAASCWLAHQALDPDSVKEC